MTLQDIRHAMAEHGGGIKAFALRWGTVEGIVSELGVAGTQRAPTDFCPPLPPENVTVFDVPVIVVTDNQPEGVIV